MTQEAIDVDVSTLREQQRALWNASARVWDEWHDDLERWFRAVNQRLFELAGLAVGQAVLDVGTGCGEPATAVASIVGPRGSVLGIDVAPAMLEVARRRTRGLANVGFAELDAAALEDEKRFDAVISRLGIMLAIDRATAMGAIRRALKPGGTFAAAVWGAPTTHLLSQMLVPLLGRLDMPPPAPGAPSPFSLSDPNIFEAELRAAGFVDVSITPATVPTRFRSFAEFVRFNREALPESMLDAIRRRFGSDDSAEAWASVAEVARGHTDPDGSLYLPCETLCARAVTPR